jgi:tight adherence protein B
MVGREMSDPVGSEFGMVGDEMTYGLDLGTAMGNLRERTGQMDVALLAVAVSIQGKTGGNLAELLSKLGRMIRERYRVRRKIHALSAEGRFSSIALILIPLVLIAIVNTLTPSFYGAVKDDWIFMPMVYLGLTLWVFGTYVIRRMVNFKF